MSLLYRVSPRPPAFRCGATTGAAQHTPTRHPRATRLHTPPRKTYPPPLCYPTHAARNRHCGPRASRRGCDRRGRVGPGSSNRSAEPCTPQRDMPSGMRRRRAVARGQCRPGPRNDGAAVAVSPPHSRRHRHAHPEPSPGQPCAGAYVAPRPAACPARPPRFRLGAVACGAAPSHETTRCPGYITDLVLYSRVRRRVVSPRARDSSRGGSNPVRRPPGAGGGPDEPAGPIAMSTMRRWCAVRSTNHGWPRHRCGTPGAHKLWLL